MCVLSHNSTHHTPCQATTPLARPSHPLPGQLAPCQASSLLAWPACLCSPHAAPATTKVSARFRETACDMLVEGSHSTCRGPRWPLFLNRCRECWYSRTVPIGPRWPLSLNRCRECSHFLPSPIFSCC